MKYLTTLFAAILLAASPHYAYAQTTVGTYQEQSGTTRNVVGVQGVNPATTSDKQQVQGTSANGAIDDGSNPLKVGCIYEAANPTVTEGQRATCRATATGQIQVALTTSSGTVAVVGAMATDASSVASNGLFTAARGYGFNGTSWDRMRGDTNAIAVQPALSANFWNYAAGSGGITNTTTAVTIKAAAGASVRNYLCTLKVGHDTLGAATELAVRDGAAGTVLYRGKLQTTANEGGNDITFTPCLRGTANTLMEVVTLTATVTGGVYVNASGYTGN